MKEDAEAVAGDAIWIRDLETYGVVTRVVGDVYVCQVGDAGSEDWAAVAAENAEVIR